jgi:4-alpha-glucanotransferase
MTSTIFHALGLHMHQPPGNLLLLIEANPFEAEQIIRCFERPVRYAERYRDVARLHLAFSGVLLEQLLDRRVVDRYRQFVDIPEMLGRYAAADNIELIGMGQHHPIFPLIPRADWVEQLALGRATMERAFGRAPRGFCPPEMAFTMEMIPDLVEAGFEYVVIDGVHVRPEDGISDVFRPYLACHGGVCISVVPLDGDVSEAQQAGFDANWFQNEVRWRTGGSPRPHEPRLVTTWSNGENGGWFRQIDEGSGFFGHFFAPYMEHFRGGEYPITPVSLSDYLEHHPPVAHAQVQTGTWTAGPTMGPDLPRWIGTAAQRTAVAEVNHLSGRYWDLRERLAEAAARGVPTGQCSLDLAQARRLILEAETSCFLYWGEAWIPLLYQRTRPAALALDQVESFLTSARAPVAPAPTAGAAPDTAARPVVSAAPTAAADPVPELAHPVVPGAPAAAGSLAAAVSTGSPTAVTPFEDRLAATPRSEAPAAVPDAVIPTAVPAGPPSARSVATPVAATPTAGPAAPKSRR